MEECIDSSRPPPVDRLVYELSERIQSIIDEHPELNDDGANVTLELEGRLGCIINAETRERIKLPIENEVMMSSELKYNFLAGVGEKQFELLKKKLNEIFNLKMDKKSSNDLVIAKDAESEAKASSLLSNEVPPVKIQMSNTHDEFHCIEEFEKPLRFSYSLPKKAGTPPLEIIRKENILVWTIFTGKERDDEFDSGNKKDLQYKIIDFRIAVNLEYSIDFRTARNLCLNSKSLVLERKRERISYCSKLFRIDTTVVSCGSTEASKGNAGAAATPSYEIEVEINPNVIMDVFNEKNITDNALSNTNIIKLCDIFVGSLRDFCAFLNADSLEGFKECKNFNKELDRGNLVDLEKISPTIEQVQSLVKYIAKKPPLLGDYVYRAVLPIIQKKKLLGNYNENLDSEEEDFSLYTHRNIMLSGPWGTE